MSLPPRPPLNYYDGDLPMSINEFYTKYINDSSVTKQTKIMLRKDHLCTSGKVFVHTS